MSEPKHSPTGPKAYETINGVSLFASPADDRCTYFGLDCYICEPWCECGDGVLGEGGLPDLYNPADELGEWPSVSEAKRVARAHKHKPPPQFCAKCSEARR